MIQEDKELLLKDLSARLPYNLWVEFEGKEYLTTGYGHGRVSLLASMFSSKVGPCPLVEEVKPYLRPMSSMTEEEEEAYCDLQDKFLYSSQYPVTDAFELFDWLNAHYIDYRGLIEMGLALEAPEGMYKTE